MDMDLLSKLLKLPPQELGRLIFQMQSQKPISNIPNEMKKIIGGTNATIPVQMQDMRKGGGFPS